MARASLFDPRRFLASLVRNWKLQNIINQFILHSRHLCLSWLWRGHPVEVYYDKRWLMVLWSTQEEVEGIMLKSAWH